MVIKKAVAKKKTFGIGDLSNFQEGGGFGFREGTYSWDKIRHEFYTYRNKEGQKVGDPTLSIVIHNTRIDPPVGDDEEIRPMVYGLGKKAHLAFMPSDDGTTLEEVDDPKGGIYSGTKGHMLIKSLLDCGMPAEFLGDDISVLDGIVVRMSPVPEPESWSEFRNQQSSTGEATDAPQKKTPKTIGLVTEVVEAPWEEEEEKPAKKSAKAAPAKGKAKVAEPEEEEEEEAAEDSEDVEAAATDAVSTFLENNEEGGGRIMFQTSVFKAVKTKHGQDTADAVVEAYFQDEDSLNGLLNPLGYEVSGTKIAKRAKKGKK